MNQYSLLEENVNDVLFTSPQVTQDEDEGLTIEYKVYKIKTKAFLSCERGGD